MLPATRSEQLSGVLSNILLLPCEKFFIFPYFPFTFLEKFDFTGKTIKPFCTHEGSGMGRSETDIQRLCPNAKVELGLAIHGSSAAKAGPALKNWAESFREV